MQRTTDAAAADDDFQRQVYELAEYWIGQGGVTHLHEIKTPDHSDESSP